jgi:DNA-binding MarR family transcriptional regulator
MAQTPRTPARRSPTADELAIWRDYLETSEAVRRMLAAGLQTSSGISPGDYSVMLALSEAPDRELRSSALADLCGWERSRLSHHLRRMEDRALVARRQADDDARSAIVVLTDAGARIFRSSSAAHLRLVREVFVDAFTPEQLEGVRTTTAALRRHVDERAAAAAPARP